MGWVTVWFAAFGLSEFLFCVALMVGVWIVEFRCCGFSARVSWFCGLVLGVCCFGLLGCCARCCDLSDWL